MIIVMLVLVPVQLVLMVVVHETGHFIGGKTAGYRLTHIKMFNVYAERHEGKIRIVFRKGAFDPLGQCMMSGDEKLRPGRLILGGCAANILVGAAAAVIMLVTPNLVVFGASAVVATLNLVFGLSNLLSRSLSCDGAVYREVRGERVLETGYNRIMQISERLKGTDTFGTLEPELLGRMQSGSTSGVSADLCYYGYLGKFENARAKDLNELKGLLGQLRRYSEDLTGDSVRTENEILKKCRSRGTEKFDGNAVDDCLTGDPREALSRLLDFDVQQDSEIKTVCDRIRAKARREAYPGEWISAANSFVAAIGIRREETKNI